MATKDWMLYDKTVNSKGVTIRKMWVLKKDHHVQLSLITVMPYAHVLHFEGWEGESLGTFRTFNEGERKAKEYMKTH